MKVLLDNNFDILKKMNDERTFSEISSIDSSRFNIISDEGLSGNRPEAVLLKYHDQKKTINNLSDNEINSLTNNNSVKKYYFTYVTNSGMNWGNHTSIQQPYALWLELDVNGDGSPDIMITYTIETLKYVAGHGGGPLQPGRPL